MFMDYSNALMSTERLSVISRHLTSGKMPRPPITAHVLDTSRGRPASNLEMKLYQKQNDNWILLDTKKTDGNGRCDSFALKQIPKGFYKIFFDTGTYFGDLKLNSFYPFVEVVFEIKETDEHYHIPLLLSPYGYTTYRGS